MPNLLSMLGQDRLSQNELSKRAQMISWRLQAIRLHLVITLKQNPNAKHDIILSIFYFCHKSSFVSLTSEFCSSMHFGSNMWPTAQSRHYFGINVHLIDLLQDSHSFALLDS